MHCVCIHYAVYVHCVRIYILCVYTLGGVCTPPRSVLSWSPWFVCLFVCLYHTLSQPPLGSYAGVLNKWPPPSFDPPSCFSMSHSLSLSVLVLPYDLFCEVPVCRPRFGLGEVSSVCGYLTETTICLVCYKLLYPLQRYTVLGSVVLCGGWYWNFSKLFEKTGLQHHFGCPNRHLRVVEQPSEVEDRSAACP